jgi:hypothetical protein
MYIMLPFDPKVKPFSVVFTQQKGVVNQQLTEPSVSCCFLAKN